MKYLGTPPKISILPSVKKKIEFYGKLGAEKKKFYFLLAVMPHKDDADISDGDEFTIVDAVIIEQQSNYTDSLITKDEVCTYFGYTEKKELEDGQETYVMYNGIGHTTGVKNSTCELTDDTRKKMLGLIDHLDWSLLVNVSGDGTTSYNIVDHGKSILWDNLKVEEYFVGMPSYEDIQDEYKYAVKEVGYYTGSTGYYTGGTGQYNNNSVQSIKRSPSELATKKPGVKDLFGGVG